MRDIFNFFEQTKSPIDFESLKIMLASPERIRDWSSGEVRKPETINYRTFKPERDGLFCARIFGPVKDYECICGKYKRMKHRGIVCEKCGVEVIQSKVRRERLGHITLATPVAHIWFLKSLPSRIGNVLDITLKDLEKVLYCVSYIVKDPGITPLQKYEVLSESKYLAYIEEFGEGSFDAGMGAEVIRELLEDIDIYQISDDLRAEMKQATSEAKRKKIAKRLKVIEAFKSSDNRPEWMILEVVPIIPPDLRPLVPLDGGRFATSDLNDLYRRVINRNNRLKRLMELRAPEIIVRNEKRMLQEAVDALFDNGRRGKTITGPNKRPLKSLSDMLKGKQGRFRQNLLGKRVDYSGRSVIVVGPELRLHQCGLPKKMALELFKPFIYNRLEAHGYVSTIKSAKKMVEKETDEVWDILDEVINEHPVILNRAPTLHRLGVQAFEPVLIEGKAIQVHPLVCTAFNADFDGDQMAVHVPLSIEAQMEARVLMMSTNNILKPANGKPIIGPTQDIVLGCYYMTRERSYVKGEGRTFYGFDEVRTAYDHGAIDLQASIVVRTDEGRIKTTVGRVLLYEVVPENIPFKLVNNVMDKAALDRLIAYAYRFCGDKDTVLLADHLRTVGYEYATRAGISISVSDMIIPENKWDILKLASKDALEIDRQRNEGAITDGERYNKVVDVWATATEDVAEAMMRGIAEQEIVSPDGETLVMPSFNSVFIMADSGARGSAQQMRQLSGMRGLMAKPSGEIIETPITANFREGLTVLQYFISTHGARKGLADTALKTANSGYLTRRLVDVAQDAIVTEHDCGTLDGIDIVALVDGGEIIESLGERILGRVSLEPIINPHTDEMIVGFNEEIDEGFADKILDSGLESVRIRSVLTCQARRGICQLCYGRDLARNRMVNLGEAAGVIAAQSIGEPGTQLTMRTFHFGGVGTLEVQESSLETRSGGIVEYENLKGAERENGSIVVMNRNAELVVRDQEGRQKERYSLVYGSILNFKSGEKPEPGASLAEWDPFSNPILTGHAGIVDFADIVEGVNMEESVDKVTYLSKMTIKESSDLDIKPRIVIRDKDSKKLLSSYTLPVGAVINVNTEDPCDVGDILAKMPRESQKNKDITGGLPRVAELFEARKPKEMSIVTEVDGVVSYGKDTKGKTKLIVTPEFGDPVEYLIPKTKQVSVQDGDNVRAGDPLMEGSVNPHDILRIKGRKELSKHMVDEVQQVYRLQGVKIHDKHIEVIVRQMLRRVRIVDVGDTGLLIDETITRPEFAKVNQETVEEGGMPAVAEDLLLGITKASISTDSFVAAASFQETTKVLTNAAVHGRVDGLSGLKENVIMGRLIPAGTGLGTYRFLDLVLEPEAAEEEFVEALNIE